MTYKVAFVCLRGSAQSLIAAEYFGQIGLTLGLDLKATSSGLKPDSRVPSNILEGLSKHTIGAWRYRPKKLTARGLAAADLIVSFDCEVAQRLAPGKPIERWDGCPAASQDFETAWRFIAPRVGQLVERLHAAGLLRSRLS